MQASENETTVQYREHSYAEKKNREKKHFVEEEETTQAKITIRIEREFSYM